MSDPAGVPPSGGQVERDAIPPEGGTPTPPKPPEPDDPVRTWALRGIFLALVLWGLYHTLGVFLYNHDPRKAAIVFGCAAAFLGFWALLLWLRPAARAS